MILTETYLVNSSLGRKLHSFLFLSLVAEPDPDHVLLEVELLGDGCDLLSAGPRLHGEVSLQRALLGRGDRGPFSWRSVNHSQFEQSK